MGVLLANTGLSVRALTCEVSLQEGMSPKSRLDSTLVSMPSSLMVSSSLLVTEL